jgi:hypothetical protein
MREENGILPETSPIGMEQVHAKIVELRSILAARPDALKQLDGLKSQINEKSNPDEVWDRLIQIERGFTDSH